LQELMKQVHMLDDAVSQWEAVKKELEEVGAALPSDTKAYLEDVLEEIDKQKSQEVRQFAQKYQAQLREKFLKEQSSIEKSLKERYQSLVDKILMSLLTSMHEVK